MNRFCRTAAVALVCLTPAATLWGDTFDTMAARQSLRRAIGFYRAQVSVQGGYLWRYSADLTAREGEGKAGPWTAWVQPPGTPTVGDALLRAYQWTGESIAREACRETAKALMAGQLRSGGWDYRIEFEPKTRARYAYRQPPGDPRGRNVTTLDDNTTQAALRFLIRYDHEFSGEDAAVSEAVRYALQCLLRAQYPNGAWPQRYDKFPDPAAYPVRRASYPDEWPREYPRRNYRTDYTLNDNALADMIDVMFLAAEAYEEPAYRRAAERGGEFILLAQMPDPQPAWAQQYDAAMQPVWARKFEPPAVTGGESQGVLRTLLQLYERTGDRQYLEPVQPALDYLHRSRLPDGRLARFYELRTNRPLYFTRDYELTYDDSDLPTHYAFKISAQLERIQTAYHQLRDRAWRPAPALLARPGRVVRTVSLTRAARQAAEALDERGAWVEPGQLRYFGEQRRSEPILDIRTFAQRLETLARFIASD